MDGAAASLWTNIGTGDPAAIEYTDGDVVDALFVAGLTVVMISPNQVRNQRGHY